MKNVLFATLFVLLAVPVFAGPVDEGNFVVSMPILTYDQGSGDLYENSDGDSQTVMGLAVGDYELGVQYFMMPNLAVGGILGYTSEEQGDWSQTTTTIGPMVTYYIAMDGKMFPYVGGAYIYESGETDTGAATMEYTATSLILKGGIAYMQWEDLALYAEIGYSMDSMEPDGGDSVDGTTLGIAAGIKAFF